MVRVKPKYKKYIKLGIGIFVLLLGLVFMLFPFIPLGYALLTAGLFLLAFEIPALNKYINKLKKKDRKGRVEKVEKKLKEGDQFIDKKFIRDNDDTNETNYK